jgi:hypothetical protein
MAWITPKTTWVGTDPFTAADWLRIVGNVEYLATAMSIPFTPYTSVTDGETLITSKQRNDVTDMIETLYATLYASWNRGYVMPRIDYGSAWNSKDLNIIEALIRNLKRQLDGELSSKVDYYCGKEIRCGETISLGLL